MSKFTDLLLLERHTVRGDEYEKLAQKFEKETKEDEASFLGVINLDEDNDELVTEDTIGNINLGKKAGNVIVSVRLREGWEKPHMHLEGNDFHCAVRLDIPDHFIHKPYIDTLSKKQAKIFNEYMKSKVTGSFITKWELAASIFNNKFEDHPLKITKQPDYTKLKK